jgi:hypothetical protein
LKFKINCELNETLLKVGLISNSLLLIFRRDDRRKEPTPVQEEG